MIYLFYKDPSGLKVKTVKRQGYDKEAVIIIQATDQGCLALDIRDEILSIVLELQTDNF